MINSNALISPIDFNNDRNEQLEESNHNLNMSLWSVFKSMYSKVFTGSSNYNKMTVM